MKRQLALITIALFFAVGCGNDDNNTANANNANNANNENNENNENNATNNDSNNESNNASNNGSNNESNNATNNGTNNPTNNATNNPTNNATNNPTNNGTNNNNGGAISVQAQFTPTSGPIATAVTIEFTQLTNFMLDPDNIGGADVAGSGHYHVYVDVVDDDHELLESGTNPDTFNMEIMSEVLAEGDHSLIVKVHKNDHSEYDNPIEFTFNDPFVITP